MVGKSISLTTNEIKLFVVLLESNLKIIEKYLRKNSGDLVMLKTWSEMRDLRDRLLDSLSDDERGPTNEHPPSDRGRKITHITNLLVVDITAE